MLEQSTSTNKSAIKVGVLASSEDQRGHLQSMLENSGLNIVLIEEASENTLNNINNNAPGVLLIDVGDSDDNEWDVIDAISEQSDIPILFNDSGSEGIKLDSSNTAWGRKLAQKLISLAQENTDTPEAGDEQPIAPFPLASTQTATEPAVEDNTVVDNGEPAQVKVAKELAAENTNVSEIVSGEKVEPAAVSSENANPQSDISNLNVWVLGASLGGPQAVRQFLTTINKNLPVAFILAQHIGANHISLLAEQLNRVTAFNVLPGKNGHRLQHGEVVLTPADKEIAFTDDGYLALRPAPANAIYSPSIDNVMAEVAKRFGEKAGTIVFSGMGDDGASGCESIAENNGIVWAQDIASCVVSSMPDHARKTGKVSFSANPEKLAEHLYNHYS